MVREKTRPKTSINLFDFITNHTLLEVNDKLLADLICALSGECDEVNNENPVLISLGSLLGNLAIHWQRPCVVSGMTRRVERPVASFPYMFPLKKEKPRGA
jgi:hypothetical protein